MSDASTLSPSPEEMEVFQAAYGCPRTARAGALLLHGLGEHSRRHRPLLELLVHHGIYCRTFDWPGHGLSPGQRGHLESLSHITHLVRRQMSLLRDEMGPDKSLGLLGHSMGGFFALYILTHHPRLADFAWIGSPLIDPRANASWFKRKVALFIERFCPRFPVYSGVKTSGCRRDSPAESDPLMHRRLTVRLGAILVEAADALQEHADAINPHLCLLMTHGSADTVCPAERSREFFEKLPNPAKTYILLQGALHEPFVGPGRQAFFQAIETWVTDELSPRLEKPAPAATKT